ncbi:MAG: hypothetical protein ACOYI8_07070 [Christensenellales bacterium]|jgi:5-methylcytosine-specific restriction protein B
MIDLGKLKPILAEYKAYFPQHWNDEKYKWEAVKHFQDNWDVSASDFPEIMSRSLYSADNLLASRNHFPKGMIVGFAKAAPEEMRSIFFALFDENKDIFERMNVFRSLA